MEGAERKGEALAALEALAEHASQLGLLVRYVRNNPDSLAARFHVQAMNPKGPSGRSAQGVVTLYVTHADDQRHMPGGLPHERDADECIDELLTFAHEIGHAVSWQRGNHSPELEAAMPRQWLHGRDLLASPLTAVERMLVAQEEARAWSWAREWCSTLSLPDLHMRLLQREEASKSAAMNRELGALGRVYRQLWERARASGLFISYHVDDGHGRAGGFLPAEPPPVDYVHPESLPPLPLGRVELYRDDEVPWPDDVPAPPSDMEALQDELMTLAHEVGHFRSLERDTRPLGMTALMMRVEGHVEGEPPPLTPTEFAALYAEEQAAWRYARNELEAVWFADWESFSEREARSLKFSAQRLAGEKLHD